MKIKLFKRVSVAFLCLACSACAVISPGVSVTKDIAFGSAGVFGSSQETKYSSSYYITPLSDAQSLALIKEHMGTDHAALAKTHVKTGVAAPEEFTKSVTKETGNWNWGGYVVNSSNVVGAYGDFNVTANAAGQIAAWVGIGGYNGATNLAQAGVYYATEQAWIELYPASPTFVFSVQLGDEMSSTVAYDFDYKEWYICIMDDTTGTYYDGLYNFNPSQAFAEWVIENQLSTAPFQN